MASVVPAEPSPVVEGIHQVTAAFTGLYERALQTVNNPWVRGVATTAGTRAVVLVFGLGSTIALARGLGPSGRGVYALAMTAATLGVVILNLGFHTANTSLASRERETIPKLVSNTFAMAAATASAGVLLLALSRILGIDPDPIPLGLAVLVVAWVPVGLVFVQLQPLLLVLGRLRRYNAAEGTWQIASVALVLGLWATGHLTPTSAFLVTLLAFAAGATAVALNVGWFRHPKPRPSIRLFRRALPYATGSYATTVTGIALLRLDLFVVESRLGTSQLGLYSVAATICEAIQILPGTIGALLLPKIAALPDDIERWAVTRRVVLITAVLMLLVCGAVALLAEVGIETVYGAEYSASAAPLYWLLPGIVFLGINTILIYHFLAGKVPGFIIVAQGLAVVLNLGLDIVLLDPLGLVGAGLASTIAYGAMLAMTLGYALVWRRRQPRGALP